MYLLRVIPLHRRIPGGELSYISKDFFALGQIISIPIKKSFEDGLIVSCKKVEQEKTYIKSLPFILLNIDAPNKIEKKVLPAVLSAIEKTAAYTLCPVDSIVRALFSKTDKKIIVENNSIVISSRAQKDYVSFHNFIYYFLQDRKKIEEIILHEPERLSDYGLIYLGFDPVAFLVLLVRELQIKLNLPVSRLRYYEWLNRSKNGRPVVNDDIGRENLLIVSRQDENSGEKSLAISPLLQDSLIEKVRQSKRIIVIGTSKGFSPKTSCADCGTLHICSNCQNPLRLVKNARVYAKRFGIAGDYVFVCNNCGNGETSYAKCRNCDSWHLTPLGYGTERIKENLESIIPKEKIFDCTQRTSIKEKKIWEQSGGISVVTLDTIRDFDDCDIAILPSLAGILYGQSFEASEKARSLLQYANKCKEKMLVFVMKIDEKEFLETANTEWEKTELTDRELFFYPPFARHVVIILDPYASKSLKIQTAISHVLNNHCIKDTFAISKDILGIVTMSASFDSRNWSILHDNYSSAIDLEPKLAPFRKYLTIRVY